MAAVGSVQTAESDYRQAIAKFATGVTIVTATDRDGSPSGMTASAVSSLSLQPLQLLVCISTHLPSHEIIASSGRFAVNVLGEGHDDLALQFANPDVDKFAGVSVRQGESAPVLADAIAVFECEVAEMLPGGDHTIFIGRVTGCHHDPDARPLVYWSSRFEALA
jgi:3-hydroxy-9,10-secoandrosta-1,3,5(10)-triene-9,17-dione monooxygenase reductase component